MMCKTVKKGLVGAGLGALVLGLLFGTSAPHYVKTAFNKVRACAERNVPIEYKIDEARQQVAALEPAIMENIDALLWAQLEAEELQDQIQTAKANLKEQAGEMLALKEGLEEGRRELTGRGGLTYSAAEVREDLGRRLDTYRRTKETVGNLEETLKAKLQHVEAIKDALEEMSSQKKALLAKIEAVESRLAQIRATQTTNEFSYDTTPLSKAKATINALDKQLEIMSRRAELEGRYIERGVSVEVETDRDVVSEVEAELEGLALDPEAEATPST